MILIKTILAINVPDRQKRKSEEYKHLISDGYVKNALIFREIEKGFYASAYRSILGGLVAEN